jgi:hypothetical protein
MCKTLDNELYSLYYGTDKRSLKQVMQRKISRHNIDPPGNSQYGLFYWNFTLTDIQTAFDMDKVIDYGVLL